MLPLRSFHCETIPPVGAEVRLDAEESAHAVRVLRLRPGDRLRLLDGAGTRATAQIVGEEGRPRREQLRCRVETRERWAPPRRRLHLLVAPPRAKLMAQVIRDSTELGIARLTPVLCAFSVARPELADGGRHWRAEAVAALKQSGNPFLPELDEPMPFLHALGLTAPGCGVYGDPAGESPRAYLGAGLEPGPTFALWVGPEGGFAPAERSALDHHRVRPLAVGPWALRVETAATALVACILGIGDDDFRCRPLE